MGTKTGKGFYSYPAPGYEQEGFLDSAVDDSVIHHALARALVRSAVIIALKDVAESKDIDRTWNIGTGQEKAPFEILKQIGVDEFLAMSEKLPEQLGLISAEDKELVEAYIKSL